LHAPLIPPPSDQSQQKGIPGYVQQMKDQADAAADSTDTLDAATKKL